MADSQNIQVHDLKELADRAAGLIKSEKDVATGTNAIPFGDKKGADRQSSKQTVGSLLEAMKVLESASGNGNGASQVRPSPDTDDTLAKFRGLMQQNRKAAAIFKAPETLPPNEPALSKAPEQAKVDPLRALDTALPDIFETDAVQDQTESDLQATANSVAAEVGAMLELPDAAKATSEAAQREVRSEENKQAHAGENKEAGGLEALKSDKPAPPSMESSVGAPSVPPLSGIGHVLEDGASDKPDFFTIRRSLRFLHFKCEVNRALDSQMKGEFEALQEVMARASVRYDKMQRSYDMRQDQQQQLLAAQKQAADVQRQLDEANADNKNLQRQIDEINERMNDANLSHEMAVAAMKHDIETVEQELKASEDKVEGVLREKKDALAQTELNAKEHELSKDRIRLLEAETIVLRDALSQACDTIADDMARRQATENQIQDLENRLADVNTHVDGYESGVAVRSASLQPLPVASETTISEPFKAEMSDMKPAESEIGDSELEGLPDMAEDAGSAKPNAAKVAEQHQTAAAE